MRRAQGWIALFALLWLSACCAMPKPKVTQAAVKTRWVGKTKSIVTRCPDITLASGWTFRPLFPIAGRGPKVEQAARKAGLHRYCVAEYVGPEKDPILPRRLRALLNRAEPDSIAVTPAAGPGLDTMTADPFFKRFATQVKRPIRLFAGSDDPPRVRLSFVDSQPTGTGIPARPSRPEASLESEHGYSLMQIAGYLSGLEPAEPSPLGPSGPIGLAAQPLQIASRLALHLPRSASEPHAPVAVTGRLGEPAHSDIVGGAVGTFAQLGKAIWDEVADWLAGSQETPNPEHLVLNLSVGWDGEKFGGWEPYASMATGVEPIYRALEFAAENQVLVIAAAGNDRPCPYPTELPLLPGGWQKPGRWHPAGGPARPLVYAVSGVDARNYPLVNTRTQGEAPLVAYGDHVVVPDLHDRRVHTGTLTGTSVSSAVVSTVAALVWNHLPGLTPEGVMNRLKASAEEIDRTPNFAAARDERVLRISLCPALSRVCPSCARYCEVSAASLPPLEDALGDFKPTIPMNGALFSELVSGAPSCVLAPIYFDPARPPLPPQIPCPAERLPNLFDQPWVDTQPGIDPCPDCNVTRIGGGTGGRPEGLVAPGFGSSLGMSSAPPTTFTTERLVPAPRYKLRAEIPEEFRGYDLLGATLEIFDLEGGRRVAVGGCSIGGLLPGGMSLEMTDLCFSPLPDPFQAKLTFTLAPTGSASGVGVFSIQSPLFIEN